MCTVSYIPVSPGIDPEKTSRSLTNKQYVLTSNRDERKTRLTIPPVAQVIGDTTVYFPKDKEAGGSWIAAGDNGRICCLLNGAYEKHERKASYARSRGHLLLETFKYENIYNFFNLIELKDFEPFTLIVVEMEDVPKLIEIRWDGIEQHIQELDPDRPYIWSSATLYGKRARMQREEWFNEWLEKESNFDRKNILKFHSSTHGDDRKNDVIMEREHGLQTVSITQVAFGSDNFSMYYYDLLLDQMTSITKDVKNAAIY